jgi:hypothetical protein
VITTYPDPPSFLANDASITSATAIGLTWVAPVFVGGSPITSYMVGWN